MPTVRQYNRQVGTAPLPGVRVPTSAPAGAFQSPLGDIANAALPISAQHDALTRKAEADADEMVVNEAERDNVANTIQILQHPETGAINKKGTNALNALPDALEAWDKQNAEIAGRLKNDYQKEQFAKRSQGQRNRMVEQIAAHTSAELRKSDAETTSSFLESGLSDVQQAPENAASAITDARRRIVEFGQRQGWTPEILKQKATAHVSDIHAAAISSLVQRGTYEAAQQAETYLAANRTELVGGQLADAEKLVDTGLAQGAGFREADAILGVNQGAELPTDAQQQGTPQDPITYEAAIAKANAIADPRSRKAALDVIDAHFSRVERAKHIARQDALTQVTKQVEASGGRLNRASKAWQTIDGTAEGEQALHRQDQILRPPKDPGDPDLYMQQLSMASISDESRQQFLQENVLKLPGLNTAQRTHLLALQRQFSVHEERATDSETRRSVAAAEAEARHYRHQAEQFAVKGDTAAATVARGYQHTAEETAGKLKGAEVTDPATIPYHDFSGGSVRVGTDKPLLAPAAPVVHPTQEMLDGAARNPRYAEYLKSMGVALPKTLRIVPPTPKEPKK